MPVYDATPVYEFQKDMPWAHEPLKTIYVWQRLFTTIFLVPLWVLYYLIMPRSFRPRPTWSIKMIVGVKFMKRIFKVTEVAGVTWSTRNPELEPTGTLKETRFQWIDPLPDELQTGIVRDEKVLVKHVGCFVWPKDPTSVSFQSSEKREFGKKDRTNLSVNPVDTNHTSIELGRVVTPTSASTIIAPLSPPVIGIFLHGGGYCHMSAHETCGPSRIPRRLVQDKICTEVYSVEYRLLQFAPVPAQIQDAASVYGHVMLNVLGAVKGIDGIYRYPSEQPSSSLGSSSSAGSDGQEATSETRPRVILIGDSAGGNLILGLTRWIRDEGTLPMPDGMFLCSPSCDPSHAFPIAPSSYIPRPHESTDYLVDTPEPRALLQRTFLGHHPVETIHSPYISPVSPRVLRAYGHSVEWEGEGGEYGPAQLRAIEAAEGNVGSMTSVPLPRTTETDQGEAGGTTLSRTGEADAAHHKEHEGADRDAEADTSATSPRLPGKSRSNMNGLDLPSVQELSPEEIMMQHYLNPAPANPAHRNSLFGDFPPCFVVLGDAERLEREIGLLIKAMQRDGVNLKIHTVKDGVHDLLTLKWWDEKERQKVWEACAQWVATCVINRRC